jgi:hypothetical protein
LSEGKIRLFKERRNEMKTMVKLVMLLAVLAMCMPAQGEILIFSKLYNCWWADSLDLVNWDVEEWTQRGFLVVDVDYYLGEIVGINQAIQVEYWKDGRDKWYWYYEEDYEVERIEVGDEVIWVIEYIHADSETSAEIIMLRGKAKAMHVGLGRDAQREVTRSVTGNVLSLDIGMGVEKEMCSFAMRLHSPWTRCANDPDECNQSLECAVLGIVVPWLERRGYEEVAQ